ncbi:MAG: ABC transporter ATP-binding protein/permease [Afipia sp.]|nr:ABC transporter ATP-binding protein/permease [Afipia sp.]
MTELPVRSDRQQLMLLVGRFLLPYWKQSALLALFSVVVATLNSVYPLLLAPAMDISVLSKPEPAKAWQDLSLNNLGVTLSDLVLGSASAASPITVVTIAVVLFVVVGSLAAIAEFATQMMSASIATKAHRDLQVALHKHVMDQELGFFLRNRVGELTTRFVVDAGEVVTSLDFALRNGLQSVIQIVLYGSLLLKTSPLLAGATLFASLAHVGVNRLVGGRLRRATAEQLNAIGRAGGFLQEGLTSIRVVKSFGAEQHEHSRFVKFASDLQRMTMRLTFCKNGESPLRRITDTATLGLILLLAFQVLNSGAMNFQGFVLFMLVVRQTIAPVSALAQAVTRIQGSLGSASRILDILERVPALPDGTIVPSGFKKQILLEDVSFSYENSKLTLKNISLELRKGEMLAVVGASGAGKSTLADLVLRLYDPVEGRITLDGEDIRSLRQAEYRKLFGVVSQEALLFNATIRENIIFGRSGFSESDLARASSIANANEFIDKMPAGMDTMVGDRGVRLSGGQRQRIAIARAIYARPEILILDEATSALDSESERLVQQAIDRVLETGTAMVIAHRLSTVVHADRIVVLSDGQIEAVGRHADLLEKSPTYRKACELQFKS